MMAPCRRLFKQLLVLATLRVALSKAQQPVCPQQGSTTITQLELVPRPKGIAKLRCDFNVPPDPTDSETGLFQIAWVIDTTSILYTHEYDPTNVNDEGRIQPGYENLVLSVTDNFQNLGQSPGSSIITLDVSLTIRNEFKCEVVLGNHQQCVDTTTIQFEGPNITLEADGEVYCQNYGTACGEIPSKDHAITCRVKNLESDRPTMTLKVNGDIISSGPPDVTTNSHRYYDGVITASYNVPDDANSTCEVTDTRGTYDIASLPDPCNPEPCNNGGTCNATDTTFTCVCLATWAGDSCNIEIESDDSTSGAITQHLMSETDQSKDEKNGATSQHMLSETKHMKIMEILKMIVIIWNTLKMATLITLL